MKTKAEWMGILSESLIAYDEEMLWDHTDDEVLSPNEVLDEVVRWLGGLCTGDDVRELVQIIYDINLEEVE